MEGRTNLYEMKCCLLENKYIFLRGQVSKQGMGCICIFHSNVDRHCKYLINENEK